MPEQQTDLGMRPLTDEERHNLATHLSGQLAKEARKNNMLEIAGRAPEMTLYEISREKMELLEFRQDCMDRLADLEALADPAKTEAAEMIADVKLELQTTEKEIAKLVVGAEAEKVDSCANLLEALYSTALYRKDQRDRHDRAAKRAEAMAQFIENIVIEALILQGQTSFRTKNNVMRIQRNPPSVRITDAQAVQDRFVKITLETTVDRWKQMREAQPDLVQHFLEKNRGFMLAAIGKLLKKAAQEEDALRQTMEGPMLEKALKQIDRPRGAQLKSDVHLRVE